MTLIIGIRCTEGIVLAADSAATMGPSGIQTAQQRTARKLIICNQGKIVVGVSGHMGLSQRLAATIEDGYNANRFKGRPEVAVGKMREALVEIVRPEWEMGQLVVNASRNPAATQYANFNMLVALPLEKQLQLVSFTETCSPELANDGLPFVCIGSGQLLADPFLSFLRRVLWPASGCPTLSDGILSAYWAMQHTIDTNPGGVGGDPQIITLQKSGSDFKAEEQNPGAISAHRESLRDFERMVREWRAQFTTAPTAPAPEAPPV